MKRRFLIGLISLVFVVLLIGFVSTWADNSSSSQNVDGCNILNTTGATYTLTQNVSSTGTCFTISAENITLDCNGYWINYSTGGADNTYGVYTNQFNTTVKNCNVVDGNWTNIAGADRIGIYFYEADRGTIFNNYVKTNNSMAIFLEGEANFNNVSDNSVYSGLNSIDIQGSDNIVMDNFANSSGVYYSFASPMMIYGGNNNTLINNNLVGKYYGLYIANVVNNTFVRNLYALSTEGTGIYSEYGYNNTFINATVIGTATYGVRFSASANNTFKDSNISGGIYSIRFEFDDGSVNNSFVNCSYNTESINGASNQLLRKWYYQAYVNNTGGSATSNANISAYNTTGQLQFTTLTNSSGWINRQEVIEYSNTGGTLSYYSNYTLFANKSGATANDTNILNVTVTLNKLNDVFTLEETNLNCGTLNSANTVYTLTQNVSSQGTCFTITQPNITLDCNNYWINYSINGTDYGRGVYSNQFNSTIRNCNIIDGNWSKVSETREGIYIDYGENCTLFNNTVKTNTSVGLSVNSNFNNITSNNIISGRGGISLSGDNNTLIENTANCTTVAAASGQGIYISGAYNYLVNNTAGSVSYALSLGERAYHTTLINNSAISSQGTALFINGVSNNLLINQLSSGNIYGVGIEGNSSNNLFFDCRLMVGSDTDLNIGYDIGALNNTFLNCSYISDNIHSVDGQIIRKWYYQAYVNNTAGSAVSNANVTAYNSSGQLQFTTLTNSSGWINRQEVTEYVNTGGTRTYSNNYTIFANKSGAVANDTNILNVTVTLNKLNDVFTLTEGADSTPPTYLQGSVNNTVAGLIAKFSINVFDETALHSNGQYVFSTNNTGVWINDTAVNFTSTPQWANVTKTLNSSVGIFVGYRWYFNDSAGNINSTNIYTLTTESALDCGILNTVNTIYTLTSNVSSIGTCFNITAANITLDCNNYWINFSTGGGLSTYGIVSNQFNTTIKNCNVVDGNPTSSADPRSVIYFNGADNGTIFNNSLKGYMFTEGIYLEGAADFNTITYNRVITNYVGIDLQGSNNLISNNLANATETGYSWAAGIIVYGADSNSFSNNTVTGAYNGFYIANGADNNNFINNTVVSTEQRAIYIEDSVNNLFRNCPNINGLISDIELSGATTINTTFINCSYSVARETAGVNTRLIRKWYYQAYTNYSNGTMVVGANISAYNTTGQLQFTTLTNSSGWINRQEVTEYVNTGGTRTYYNNYTIFANKSDTNNSTKIYNFTIQQNKINDYLTLNTTGSQSAYWTDELMVNGGFEWGNLTGWTTSGAYWQVGNVSGGEENTTSINGSYSAYTSSGTVDGYIYQDVNVSSYSSYIDSGNAEVNASGWRVSAELLYDYSRIQIIYLFGNLTEIETAIDSGYDLIQPWERIGVFRDTLPNGTRYIRVWGNTYENSYPGGSLDSFSVKLKYTGEDPNPPTYNSASHNSSLANYSVLFSINVFDETALHPNGQYVFSTNNTGVWINDTAVNFTSTPQWANVTKTLNSSVGIFVGYRWYFNDSAGNRNSTGVYTLNTSQISLYPYFTLIPNNASLFYGNESLGIYFSATDNTGFGYYRINDTRFSINQSGYLSNSTPMTVGNYEINVTVNNTLGNINWTRYKVQINKSVSDVYLYVNNLRNNVTISNGSSIWLNGTLQNGFGVISLYNNGTLINSGSSPIYNLTQFNNSGIYNITVFYSGNQNYTSDYETWWVNASNYTSSSVNQIIANHTIVDRYDDIPQYYINEVKKMLVDMGGESHSMGYQNGVDLLELYNSKFQVQTYTSTPPAETDQYLRLGRPHMYGEDIWTSQTGIDNLIDDIDSQNDTGNPFDVFGFGWCWDMTWENLPGGTEDSVFNVRWAGSTEGGANGSMRWGLDSGDEVLTGNVVSMDNYLDAIEQYNEYFSSNNIPTVAIFTTGPVDSYTDENAYQRELKHDYIRNYTLENSSRILFDYADILYYNDSGDKYTEEWNDGGDMREYAQIHPDNLLNYNSTWGMEDTGDPDSDHIGEVGALRLAKAMWWMLARISGWDGQNNTAPVTSLSSPSNGSSLSPGQIIFQCGLTDDYDLKNTTLYVWNSTGNLISSNLSSNISGTSNSTNINYTLNNDGTYLWNCLTYDGDSISNFSTTNNTLIISSGPDTTPPYFTTIPNNASLFYGNQSLGVDFDASDAVGFGYFSINDTRFSINQSGYLSNTTPLTVGNYEINVTINDTSNNINWTRYKVQINQSQNSCSVYFNTSSPITYPSTFIAYTNCTSAYTLRLNSTTISNNTLINSGVTAYNISVQRTDTQNYSNTFYQQQFIINKNTETCRVLFNATSPLTYPNTFLVWANCTSAFVLSRNGTTINNNSEQALAVGAYNFSMLRNDTSNYTMIYNETQFTITAGNISKFISVWDTRATSSGSSNSTQITLPLDAVQGEFNFTVYWGDGTSSVITSGNSENRTHNYETEGVYTINITGTIVGWRFNDNGDKLKLLEIQQWGPLNLGNNYGYFFAGASNMIITANDTLNLTATTSFPYAFSDCFNLTNIPNINLWDMGNVTNLQYLFSQSINFNQNISGWNTSSVTDMRGIFYNAYNFNGNISNWDTGKVTNMGEMFYGASSFNQNIGNWNISKVTDMGNMFQSAHDFNQNLTNWDTSKVTNMQQMFFGATNFNGNISNWNTSNVEYMYNIFYQASSFNQSIGNWNTSKVTSFEGFFYNASSFNQDISNWDTSNVTDMRYMFYRASSFNYPLGNWNTGKVMDMESMFQEALSFNQDISNWDTSNVTDMKYMFNSASSFNQNLSNWDTSNVTDMKYMFFGASAFNGNISNWDTSKVISMLEMFRSASSFNQDISNWNTSRVYNMMNLFNSASSFNQDISNWDTGEVLDMSGMFIFAGEFNQPIGNWDTGNVSDMGYMFYGATSFDQDVGSWNISNVSNMANMFYGVTLSTQNYDSLLIGWSSQIVKDDLEFHGGDSQYSNCSINNATAARAVLTDTYNWTITDGGFNESYECAIIGENLCGTLDSAGTTYTLTSNVSSNGTCFTITQPNITLDCNGYWINYSIAGANDTYGIYSNQFNTTIKNCNIVESNLSNPTNNKHGIYIYGGDNSTIFNNYINITSSHGIDVRSSSNYNNITNNLVTSVTGPVIYVYDNSDYNLLSNNLVFTNTTGIYLYGNSNNNLLINNSVSDISNLGGTRGIYLASSNNNTLINNSVSGDHSYSINLLNSLNNLIVGSNVYGGERSIVLGNSNNTLIKDCVNLSGTIWEIYISSLYSTVNNTILNCSYLQDKEYVAGEGNYIIRKWYYQAYTNYSNGTEISGANISAYNSTGDLQFTTLTNATGYISRQEVTEYVNTGGTRSYYNNYTINASLDGYDTDSNVFNFTVTQNRLDDLFTLSEVADTTPPYFTTIPNNASLFYGNQSLGVDFDASDAVGFGYFSINDTRFSINQSGYLFNITPLTVGNYEINVTINDTSNNINWTRYKVQVNQSQNSCSVYFNTSSPITYPNTFIAYTNCTSAYTLRLNSTTISNNTLINSGATAYNISVQRTDTQNYSNTFHQLQFIINKNTETCRVLFNTTSPLTYPNTFLVWANCTSAFVLSRNGTTINNNSEQALAVGTYNFSMLRNDTSNYTYIYNETQFTITAAPDTTPPTYSQFSVNNTVAGTIAKFSVNVNDDSALNPNGQYIFSTNNTGQWINDSFVSFTSTPSWANRTKTLNSSVGMIVGYRWYFNDSAGNRNSTSVYTLTTTGNLTPGENACGTLDSANTVYTLTSNISSNGTCFTITQPNITVDCAGYWINYSQSEFGYGINITSLNNITVKNCNIFGGEEENYSHAIFVYNSTNINLSKNNINTLGDISDGISIYVSNYTSINNNSIINLGYDGHGIYSSFSSYNNITNLNIDADYYGIFLEYNSNNHNFSNLDISANYGVGIVINSSADNNSFYNIDILSSGVSQGMILSSDFNYMYNLEISSNLGEGLKVSGSNNSIIRSSFNSTHNNSVYFDEGDKNLFTNNTLLSSSGNVNSSLLSISYLAYNNSFYWNNFTETSGYYINNSNSSNKFNTTVLGIAQGNEYSGAFYKRVYDSDSDGWGNYGEEYPLNSTNWINKWTGYGQDYGPRTFRLEDLIAPTYNLVSHNNTLAGEICRFRVNISDNYRLNPNGQYIFSTNNTGVWINDSAVNFTSTPYLADTLKTLNSSLNKVVGYRWYFIDFSGNNNFTRIYTLKTEEEEEEDDDSGGGGGGGGSGDDQVILKPSYPQIQEGYETPISKGYLIQFNLSQKGQYVANISDVNRFTGVINFSINSTNYSVSLSKSVKINLNNDTYYDLEASVLTITFFNTSRMLFKEIHEDIYSSSSPGINETSLGNKTVVDFFWGVDSDNGFKFVYILIIAVIIVLISLVGYVVFVRLKKTLTPVEHKNL